MASTNDPNIPTATTASTWIVGSMTSAPNLPTSERQERGLHRINGRNGVVHTEPFTVDLVILRTCGETTKRMWGTARTLRGAKITANRVARTDGPQITGCVAVEVSADCDGVETVLHTVRCG
jgi:hypothetical protein